MQAEREETTEIMSFESREILFLSFSQLLFALEFLQLSKKTEDEEEGRAIKGIERN